MSILHINTLDFVGGAAKAMGRVHAELLKAGHSSNILVGFPTARAENVYYLNQQTARLRTVQQKILDRAGNFLNQKFAINRFAFQNTWNIPKIPVYQAADVVNLHNLHSDYFNLRALPALGKEKPLVWVLHDMWPLTGFCAADFGCGRWRMGCHDCPSLVGENRAYAIPEPIPFDRTRENWQAKKEIYASVRLHVIAPSKWILALAKESILAQNAVFHHIPHGIDLEQFSPLDRSLARDLLHLPQDKKVILFSSENISKPNKGFQYLLEAVKRLDSQEEIILLALGSKAIFQDIPENIRIIQLGWINEERFIRIAIAASDVFVMPSLSEIFGLVYLEAMACGVPSIGFRTGGVPEVIDHMQTGYLAELKDVEDLTRGLKLFLYDAELSQRIAVQCRKTAEEKFSVQDQTNRYIEVYAEAQEDFQKQSI